MDLLGSAFGRGGQERINGALNCIQRLIEEFHGARKTYPSRVLMDVFGFSRGAALARHFVNVIKQGAFDMDAKHRRLPKNAYRVGFLGIFDTVGSFGLPGNNLDSGYSFQIAPYWLDHGGLHLIADDEHRANFSLQAILAGQDLEHPVDKSESGLEEIVMPGAHSDIGGGYSSEEVQGQSNNELARIALEQMYSFARRLGVPLNTTNGPDGETVELKHFWRAEESVKAGHAALMDHYAGAPPLRGLHRRWRTLGVAAEKIALEVSKGEKELSQLAQPRVAQLEAQVLRKKRSLSDIATRQQEIEEQMRSCFSRRNEYELFMHHAQSFYAAWVHKSHSPHNRTMGMSPGIHGLEGRRAVFVAGGKDLKTISGATRAVPRAFSKGSWVDLECLKVHQRERV